MGPRYRILYLEDDQKDFELLRDLLDEEGVLENIVWASNRHGFEAALRDGMFDILLVDYNLPDFDGISALKIALEKDPDIPVVVISGTVGEEIAIETLKEGAADYVLKDRLMVRLVPVLKKTIEDAQERRKRKAAEEELRESEEKYRLLVENANDAIFIAQDGVIKFPNPRTIETIGYSAEELAKIPFSDLIHPKDRDMVLERYQKRLKGEALPSAYSSRVITREGKELWVRVSTVFVNWEGKPATLNFLRNITLQKELQTQLQQAQKMEAIGTLAGGIAHDFNNILSAVFGFTELAMDHVEKGSMLENWMREVLTAGSRAKDLVQQILAFSRQSEQELKPVQIKIIIKEALKLLRASLPTTIEIRQNILNDSLVMSDSTQIHQIVMNLCTNAGHAMQEKGGVLGVALETVELDSEFVAAHQEIEPGPYVQLTVSDTGHGMTQELIDKIFDPFYTTKEKGEGTGMGLSVVHGIVKSYGGTVNVYSEPGKGSTFKIFLPAIEKRLEAEARIAKPIPKGTERILFIDDEEPLVNIGKQLLESLGYEVTTRINSVEALELFKSRPETYDLVITDMTMPNMTGDELAQKLMAVRPDIPVIICTGFSVGITEEKAKTMGIQGLVSKPILKRDLAETIRKVLDDR